MCTVFPLQTTIKKHVLKGALVRAIQTGEILQVKSSYKLGPASRKVIKKKVVAKVPKKTAPKKKVRIGKNFRRVSM
jgi:hypothetical protein